MTMRVVQLRSGWGGEYFTLEPPLWAGHWRRGRGDRRWGRGRSGLARSAGHRRTGYTGGYAQRAVAGAEEVFEVPDGLDPQQALASLHDGLMALRLVEKAGIQPGERVMVNAAGGSLGVWLVPLAHAAGAYVIATARGERKLDLARRRDRGRLLGGELANPVRAVGGAGGEDPPCHRPRLPAGASRRRTHRHCGAHRNWGNPAARDRMMIHVTGANRRIGCHVVSPCAELWPEFGGFPPPYEVLT